MQSCFAHNLHDQLRPGMSGDEFGVSVFKCISYAGRDKQPHKIVDVQAALVYSIIKCLTQDIHRGIQIGFSVSVRHHFSCPPAEYPA